MPASVMTKVLAPFFLLWVEVRCGDGVVVVDAEAAAGVEVVDVVAVCSQIFD
jgi:hypothetical protein